MLRRALKNKKAFSLVEIITVVAIIGVLAILALVIYNNIRDQALDAKRVYDIKQLQGALEQYANDNSGLYPASSEVVPGKPLKTKDGSKVLLEKVPSNPIPRGGICKDSEYQYELNPGGRTYTLKYCLNKGNKEIAAGVCWAFPNVLCVRNDVCSCEDKAKYCCGFCAVGQICGGGVLAAKNYSLLENDIRNVYDLVSMSSGCDFSKTDNPGCDGSDNVSLTHKFKWSEANISEEANSLYDGFVNTVNLANSLAINPAARYCANLNIGKFGNWYLPAQEELLAINPSPFGFIGANYWSSTQVDNAKASTARFGGLEDRVEDKDKSEDNLIRCIHR